MLISSAKPFQIFWDLQKEQLLKYTVINSVSLAKYIPYPIMMAVGEEAPLITTSQNIPTSLTLKSF